VMPWMMSYLPDELMDDLHFAEIGIWIWIQIRIGIRSYLGSSSPIARPGLGHNFLTTGGRP